MDLTFMYVYQKERKTICMEKYGTGLHVWYKTNYTLIMLFFDFDIFYDDPDKPKQGPDSI